MQRHHVTVRWHRRIRLTVYQKPKPPLLSSASCLQRKFERWYKMYRKPGDAHLLEAWQSGHVWTWVYELADNNVTSVRLSEHG
jgi:hypothetical protein